MVRPGPGTAATAVPSHGERPAFTLGEWSCPPGVRQVQATFVGSISGFAGSTSGLPPQPCLEMAHCLGPPLPCSVLVPSPRFLCADGRVFIVFAPAHWRIA